LGCFCCPPCSFPLSFAPAAFLAALFAFSFSVFFWLAFCFTSSSIVTKLAAVPPSILVVGLTHVAATQ